MQEYDHFCVLMICSPASSSQCPPLQVVTSVPACWGGRGRWRGMATWELLPGPGRTLIAAGAGWMDKLLLMFCLQMCDCYLSDPVDSEDTPSPLPFIMVDALKNQGELFQILEVYEKVCQLWLIWVRWYYVSGLYRVCFSEKFRKYVMNIENEM